METSIANNPLAKHFRQPSIYLKLPSQGRFYDNNAIDLGATGEIPIYPMTVKDEILLRTPDALMNGESMVQMIKSCVPSINDPYQLPLSDLDAILIAIRLASYGNELEIKSNCTQCNHENEHNIDLRALLDRIQPTASYDQTHLVDGLIFELQPQKFKDINIVGQMTFEQRKLLSSIEASELSESERKQYFQDAFKKLTDLNIITLVNCIKSITTETGDRVDNPALIKEFLTNATRSTYDEIKTVVNKTIELNKLAPMTVNCEECTKEYPVDIDFNQTNFFE